MIQHRFYHKKMNLRPDDIDVSQASFTLAYPNDSFDYFDVDVQPLGLRWGTILQDTHGDGTDWVHISVTDHTGFIVNAYVDSLSANTGKYARQCTVRFYSISEAAEDVLVVLSQINEPD